MSKPTRTIRGMKNASKPKKGSSGPIAFFVSLFIVALGLIQLISTFQTYALNLAELNGLKRQEAALIEQKQELENDIKRWDDKAYVTAQARERLGFVFPGEQAIRVEHPEAVTGQTENKDDDTKTSSDKVLAWYSELEYAFKQADAPENSSQDASDADSAADGGSGQHTDDQQSASTNTGQEGAGDAAAAGGNAAQ